MDTVTLAREERERNGLWEAEISYGGEADLHRHRVGCDKNPSHQKFVPVDLFNIDHLPPDYRDNDLVEMIRALSDLTVRVTVTYVSDRRPEFSPADGTPYPYYSKRGRDTMRVGTGWVSTVSKHVDPYRTCECKECMDSHTPKTQFANLWINTSAHLVYNNVEAAHATCHLFFDTGGRPDMCSGVVTLSGMSSGWCDAECDISKMIFVTHNLDLTDRLKKAVCQFERLYKKILVKYALCSKRDADHEDNKSHVNNAVVVIVSHPHGCSKQVSVGYFVSRVKLKNGWSQYTYTTATCPGSSGARVLVVGRVWRKCLYDHSHGGNCNDNRDHNFSGLGVDCLQIHSCLPLVNERKQSSNRITNICLSS